MDSEGVLRHADGRYQTGTVGGPGCKGHRRQRVLVTAIRAAATPEQAIEVFAKLRQMALDGDVRAAALWCLYVLGKPRYVVPEDDPEDADKIKQIVWREINGNGHGRSDGDRATL